MKVLVLGGGGFIGKHLIARLSQIDVDVLSMDLTEPLNTYPKVTYYRGDIINTAQWQHIMENVDAIFHLFSTTVPLSSNAQVERDIQTNLITSVNILEAAAHYNVKKIIFPSSGGTVYGQSSSFPLTELAPTNPISSYGIIKLAIEKYLEMFHKINGIKPMILRISNAYGPGQIAKPSQGIIARLLYDALSGRETEIWGDGSAIRDYVYILDIVDAMVKSLFYTGSETILNISSGEGHSIKELIEILDNVYSLNLKVRFIGTKPHDLPINILDNKKAKNVLNWKPKTSLESGLQLTIDWYRSYLNKEDVSII